MLNEPPAPLTEPRRVALPPPGMASGRERERKEEHTRGEGGGTARKERTPDEKRDTDINRQDMI